MRRLVLVLLLLTLCLPSAFARRKKAKAGTVDKLTFVDDKYQFSLKLLDNWKYKIGDEEENVRLTLVQKNYQIPPDYMDAEDYTQVPRIVVWSGETNLSPTAFVDSLLSDSYDSDQKDDIYKEFELINESSAGSGTYREELVPKGKKTFELDGQQALLWKGYVKYMKEVALSASSTGGKRVRGAYGGSIVAVKKGQNIVLFHVICEWQYYPQIESEMMEMVSSLKWPESKPKG
ncbi:MAG TPA: hypothetical protein PLF13_06275 [candidate division Zixibacteria bacterium]|mgnify:CR=1 FL=1|nr:hypothetical protein [candidate division Zixibacteria bacterium]